MGMRISKFMAEPRQIWLVRHGETEWSKTGQHTGRSDLELTPVGIEEAKSAAALLDGQTFSEVLCSPLKRARQTCEIAGFDGQARIEPLCMEWDYGDLNGRTRGQIKADLGSDWNIWDGPVPNGETLEEVAARARQVIDSLPPEGSTLIFAHGHFLRILTTVYLELPPTAARHFALRTAAISILGLDNGHSALLVWNRK